MKVVFAVANDFRKFPFILENVYDNLKTKQHYLLKPYLDRGGQNGPLRVFAKYLKNGLANLHETLRLLKPI